MAASHALQSHSQTQTSMTTNVPRREPRCSNGLNGAAPRLRNTSAHENGNHRQGRDQPGRGKNCRRICLAVCKREPAFSVQIDMEFRKLNSQLSCALRACDSGRSATTAGISPPQISQNSRALRRFEAMILRLVCSQNLIFQRLAEGEDGTLPLS